MMKSPSESCWLGGAMLMRSNTLKSQEVRLTIPYGLERGVKASTVTMERRCCEGTLMTDDSPNRSTGNLMMTVLAVGRTGFNDHGFEQSPKRRTEMRRNGQNRREIGRAARPGVRTHLMYVPTKPRPVVHSYYRVVEDEQGIRLVQLSRRPRFRDDLVN